MATTSADTEHLALGLCVLGSEFRLEFDRPESRDRLARAWSRFVTEVGDGDEIHVLRVDEPGRLLSESRILTIGILISETVIADLEGNRLILRVPAVADEDGNVVAIVGGEGRHVLDAVVDLARSDMGYVTSGLLAISESGAVEPCPQPLRLVLEGPVAEGATDESTATDAHVSRTVVRGPDELGLRRCPATLTLRRIVLLDAGEASGGLPTLEPLPLIDALTALTASAATTPVASEPIQLLCRLLEQCGGAHRVVYGLGDRIADALRAALRTEARPPEPWAAIGNPSAVANAMAWRIRDGRVHRAPFVDAVEIDGEALVLVGRQPVRLSPLGLTLWREAGASSTLEDLVNAAVATHGPHPEAKALVVAAVEEMCAAGALAWGTPLTLEEALAGAAWA